MLLGGERGPAILPAFPNNFWTANALVRTERYILYLQPNRWRPGNMSFYARYVPPTAHSTTDQPQDSESPSQKRKRESEPRPKNKRPKSSTSDGQPVRQKLTNGSTNSENKVPEESTTSARTLNAASASPESGSILEKYKVTATAGRNNDEVKVHRQGQAELEDSKEPATILDSKADSAKVKKKKKDKKQKAARDEQEAVSGDEQPGKHVNVLSKFQKAKEEKQTDIPPEQLPSEDVIQPEVHGLEPIPQPELGAPPSEKPSYSILAAWQSSAVRVVHGATRKFSSFSLSDTIVSNLGKHQLEESLPVQTTVLPLLLDGQEHHDGDVCVSAATGSGKTLAYVAPMIEALKDPPGTKLRGVIVVPTRELVQQVRQLCEICAAGTGLKIATAAGSKSITDEQRTLVTEEEIYDPKEYERRQTAPVDWSNFSLEKLMRDAERNSQQGSVHFVRRFRSNVDILITTPGRLVDHLQSTEGFSLDDVNWLVVDEADRLLNESYQEWIDTVTPALQSHAATSKRDEILRYMRMKVPKRVVRKVLLSATMTRDISKLNSLGLDNPKLVILGSAGLESRAREGEDLNGVVEEPAPDADGAFHLPATISEHALPVKDGYEKPLYLVQLLESRIFNESSQDVQNEKGSTSTGKKSKTSGESDSSLSDTSSDGDSSSGSSASPPTSSAHDSSTFLSKHQRSQKPQGSSLGSQPKVLIFTRSTSAATRLSRLLSLLAPAFSPSTLTRSTSASASSRRALKAFLSGKSSILVATDRASRGLDIQNLTHVISYDVPASALTYVHRVGRTARAGKDGSAWDDGGAPRGKVVLGRNWWKEPGRRREDCERRREASEEGGDAIGRRVGWRRGKKEV